LLQVCGLMSESDRDQTMKAIVVHEFGGPKF